MGSKKLARCKNDYDRSTRTSHIVKLHRWIWEQANGPIPEGHVIHHVDGDNQNNSIENLMMVTTHEHARIHQGWVRGMDGRWMKTCPSCGEMKDVELDFYWRSRGRPVVRCKPCQSECAKQYNAKRRAADKVRAEGLALLEAGHE
jgi:hypothetical protein